MQKREPTHPSSPFPLTFDPDTTPVLQWSRTFASYADGYRRAAELLADAGLDRKHVGKAVVCDLVYPIAFLYRHHVELRLKGLFLMARRCLGETAVCESDLHLRSKMEELDFPPTHDLLTLWDTLWELLRMLHPNPAKGMNTRISKHVQALAKADQTSESFRYPFALPKPGKSHGLQTVTHLDIRGLRHELEQLAADLEKCSLNLSGHLEMIGVAFHEMTREARGPL